MAGMKNCFTIILIFLACSIHAQDDSIRKRPRRSANFGPEITAGPEAQLLFPNVVSFDVEFRYWMRIVNWEKRHAFDHTLLVSPGFAYGRKEAFFRLRLGDLINLNIGGIASSYRYFRLGVNAEWLCNADNRVWSAQSHFGFRNSRLYYYLGASYPFYVKRGEMPVHTNMIFGIKYYLYNAYTYLN